MLPLSFYYICNERSSEKEGLEYFMAKTITLFCSAGMSTSLLVNKMKQEAEKRGVEYNIAAYSLNEAPKYGPDADVILIGPQVRYALTSLRRNSLISLYPQLRCVLMV